ncbi:MAG: hypothetical protein KGZ57_04660 [Dethiobacter sp.]|nr:hypothetical protein [Dethiobacter sp.]
MEVTLTENTLMITEPEQYRIEVIRFWQDSMAAQILGDAARRQLRFNVIGGEQLLYLRIPQGMQIEESKYHLQFVNRDQP